MSFWFRHFSLGFLFFSRELKRNMVRETLKVVHCVARYFGLAPRGVLWLHLTNFHFSLPSLLKSCPLSLPMLIISLKRKSFASNKWSCDMNRENTIKAKYQSCVHVPSLIFNRPPIPPPSYTRSVAAHFAPDYRGMQAQDGRLWTSVVRFFSDFYWPSRDCHPALSASRQGMVGLTWFWGDFYPKHIFLGGFVTHFQVATFSPHLQIHSVWVGVGVGVGVREWGGALSFHKFATLLCLLSRSMLFLMTMIAFLFSSVQRRLGWQRFCCTCCRASLPPPPWSCVVFYWSAVKNTFQLL